MSTLPNLLQRVPEFQALGSLFQALIFGHTVAQLVQYCEGFPRDRLVLKALAWVSFLVSLLVTVLGMQSTASASGPPSTNIERARNWNLIDNAICGAYLTSTRDAEVFACQTFLAWKIYHFSRRAWLPSVVCVLALLQWAAIIAYSTSGFNLFNNVWSPEFVASFSTNSFIAWLAINIASSVIITASIVWRLHQGSAAILKRKQSLAGRIFGFTLETGLIQTVWMTVQLILSVRLDLRMPVYFIFGQGSGSLYTVWLLATLNARPALDKGIPSFVDPDGLPSAPGELRFRHPTVDGAEVVISVVSKAEASDGASDKAELFVTTKDGKHAAGGV
ncbi:hypothetical protein EYR40_007343 [Pleurotus pulmonarius]|nr:hypothetical protein EYR40_007343 [Pleurotus pulmonarius]